MATLERFYTECSTFWRPEWRRSRRRTAERLENADDPEGDSDEPSRGVPRRDYFQNFRFGFSRSGRRNSSLSCSLAFCLCVVSIVLFLDRTVDVEMRDQQYIEWSSRSAKLVYDHARDSGSPGARFGSTPSKFRSASDTLHRKKGSSGYGGSDSDFHFDGSRDENKRSSTNTTSSISHPEKTLKGWGASTRAGPSRRLLKTKGALRGLGTTFRRGSRAMNELVVVHLDEQTALTDFKLFLRTLHRSGVTARADVVILSPRGLCEEFALALHDEEKSFWRLMVREQSVAPTHVENQQKSSKTPRTRDSAQGIIDVSNANTSGSGSNSSWPLSRATNGGFTGHKAVVKQTRQMSLPEKLVGQLKDAGLYSPPTKTVYHGEELLAESFAQSPSRSPYGSGRKPLRKAPGGVNGSINRFNVEAFWQSREEGMREKGKGRRRGGEIPWENPDVEVGDRIDDKKQAAVTWGDWGSVVVFDMQDLGSEEIMSGFIKDPPANLQRWICYELLLGVVKKQYSMVLLTEVTGVVLLGDVMSTVRNSAISADGAFVLSEDRTWNQAHREEFGSLGASVNGGPVLMKDHKLANLTSLLGGNTSGVDYTGRFFIRSVYGTKTWRKLEEVELQRSVLVSGILLGNIKTVQILSKAMTIEIVRVAAFLRKSAEPFPDQPVLNYLLLKSTTLGRKLRGKLEFVPNDLLGVHLVTRANQETDFFQEYRFAGSQYHALHGFKDELVSKATGDLIFRSIHAEICSSKGASDVYDDCHVLHKPSSTSNSGL